MITSKGLLTKEEKEQKLLDAREYHKDILQHYNAKATDFNFKKEFMDARQKVVGIFPSEFKKDNGFFLEFIDSNLDPTDKERKLYRLQPTENYEDIYNLLQSGSYAVPLEDLEVASIPVKEKKKDFEVNFDTLNEIKDDNISNMTITDFAAIMWMKPVSTRPWLNNLINQNL